MILEFLKWIKNEEYSKNVQYFVASTIYKKEKKIKLTYYNCNRSGKFVINYYYNRLLQIIILNNLGKIQEKKEKTKITKLNGSCKINRSCTSQIVIKKDLTAGTISGTYYPQHYGHAIDIKHIPLPTMTKEYVAKKLHSGVTPSR